MLGYLQKHHGNRELDLKKRSINFSCGATSVEEWTQFCSVLLFLSLYKLIGSALHNSSSFSCVPFNPNELNPCTDLGF